MNILQIITEPFINFLQEMLESFLVDQEVNAKIIITNILKTEDTGIIFLVLGIWFIYFFILYKYKKNSIKKILNLQIIKFNFRVDNLKREIKNMKQKPKSYFKGLLDSVIDSLNEFKYVQASLIFVVIVPITSNLFSPLLQLTLLSINILELLFLGIFWACLVFSLIKEVFKSNKYLLPGMLLVIVIISIVDFILRIWLS